MVYFPEKRWFYPCMCLLFSGRIAINCLGIDLQTPASAETEFVLCTLVQVVDLWESWRDLKTYILLACLSRLASPLCALDFFYLLPYKSIMLQLLSVLWALCCGYCVGNTRAFGKELRSLVWWVV